MEALSLQGNPRDECPIDAVQLWLKETQHGTYHLVLGFGRSRRRIGLLRWAFGRVSMGLARELDRLSRSLFCHALGSLAHCRAADRAQKDGRFATSRCQKLRFSALWSDAR
jgi:hypothetical protein